MSNSTFNPRSLGALQPYVNNNPYNIISVRAPGVTDKAPIGQKWVNTATNTVYDLTSITNGEFNWTASGGTGGGTFTAVTITGGPGTVLDVQEGDVVITNGDLTVTAGNASIGGNLDVSGDVTVNGDFDLTSADAIGFTTTFDGAPAILLHANGGTSETIQIRSEQGTSDLSVNMLSDDGGIALLAQNSTSANAVSIQAPSGTVAIYGDRMLLQSTDTAADSITINANDAGGGITLTSGTAGMTLAAADGDITITSGIGDIKIGNDATAKTITIGSTTSTTAIDMHVGSGGFALNGVTNSTYAIGAATTTGTISIGGTAQTGNLTLGSSSGTQAVRIANGSGASAVTIANVQVAGSVAIGTAMTTGTISIGGTGLQTGNFDLAPGTGAQAVTLANGGTGIKTVRIATAAVANDVVIGSTTASASTTIQAGTGATGLLLNAGGNVQVDPGEDSIASPGDTATINTRVGVATFTGFTTAMGASDTISVLNSKVLTTSGVLATVTSLDASTNGALLTVDGIVISAGRIDIAFTNNGAGALGAGDNILLSFWVLS